MSEIQNKVVIITGASSGLGAATAERLASSGAKLMLAARREDRLKEMVSAIERSVWTADYLVTDVSVGVASPLEIRSTNISPGAIATELTSTISDPDTATRLNTFYAKTAIL
jgi:NADP-dependent 3-hydroxy acid dehydrogenase YdfG